MRLRETSRSWLKTALSSPVYFAQVREDPRLDLAIAKSFGKPIDMLMVCSGGCTLASLVSSQIARSLVVCDINPAQLALGKLKLSLLQQSEDFRLGLLGHSDATESERKGWVNRWLEQHALPAETFGQAHVWERLGLDYCGRYEILFAELQAQLGVNPRLLNSHQRETAFRDVLSQENLIQLFGEDATANGTLEFWRHFHTQTEQALAKLGSEDNPFLNQMLNGQFGATRYDWLEAPVIQELPRISWSNDSMFATLCTQDSNSKDFVHLSNILDWLAPELARLTLIEATRVLRPGGKVIVRQLNSNLKIPLLHQALRWENNLSAQLLSRDRSFFYRSIHVGTLPW